MIRGSIWPPAAQAVLLRTHLTGANDVAQASLISAIMLCSVISTNYPWDAVARTSIGDLSHTSWVDGVSAGQLVFVAVDLSLSVPAATTHPLVAHGEEDLLALLPIASAMARCRKMSVR